MGGKETDHKNAQGSLNTTSLVSKCWSGGDVSFKKLNTQQTLFHDVIEVIQGQNGCQIKNLGFSHNL